MKLLLIGNLGQLGWELERCLAPLAEVVALDFPEINLADPVSIIDLIYQIKPEGLLNASAYTAVDRAEVEKDLAYAVNAVGPGILAQQARKIQAFFIHFSTDYVFDGSKGSPYLEEDSPNPLNVYGHTKLEGERAVEQVGGAYLTFRTAWVYSLRKDSFVTKVLGWARKQKVMQLVTDQISNPTWARMLAETIALIVAKSSGSSYEYFTDKAGLYHLAGDGYASRMEWGKAILRFDPKSEEQIVEEILPAQTSEFPTPAQRPLYSALKCEKFKTSFGLALPPWDQALRWSLQE
jgi:dTDP-4-dehydrorhamnose reductase